MAAILALVLQVSGLFAPFDLLLRDVLIRRLPPEAAGGVAVVLIDDGAIRAFGRWPWSRNRLAALVDACRDAGASGVVLDILLPEPAPGDAELSRALGRGPSVLAAGMDDGGRFLLPAPGLGSHALGHVSFDPDRDGTIRSFAASRQVGDRMLPALPVAAARLLDPRLPVPVGRVLRPGFRTRALPVAGAAEVLAGKAGGALRGRVVFIGASAAGIGDRVFSPATREGAPDPGVLVEAISAQAFLSGDLLRSAPPVAAAVAFLLSLAGIPLLGASRRARLLLAPVLIAPVAFSVLAMAAFRLESGVLAPGAGLLGALGIAASDRARKARHAMGSARDRIRELEGLQEGLAEARRQESEARRVVAHELKTPITSVKGLAQLLAQFDLSGPERERVARMVVSETSRLAGMVDALLDLERLRLRDFGRDARALDLSSLCEVRLGFLRAGAGRPLEGFIQDGVHVQGDPALLERVLENLVSNALKFSPEGSPVRVSLAAAGREALLEVEDRGPGIPEEERARIFGRFQRGAAQGLAPGLGLGLALVAEVVAWHGGAVDVLAGTTGGSRFRVRLPLLSSS